MPSPTGRKGFVRKEFFTAARTRSAVIGNWVSGAPAARELPGTAGSRFARTASRWRRASPRAGLAR